MWVELSLGWEVKFGKAESWSDGRRPRMVCLFGHKCCSYDLSHVRDNVLLYQVIKVVRALPRMADLNSFKVGTLAAA